MATVNSTVLFPSIKFIATDGSGDLEEVVAVPAVNASRSHDGLTFTAVTAGVVGNQLSVEIVEDATATGVEFSADGNKITLSAQTISASQDSLVHDGVTYSSVNLGDSGIVVTIRESQGADAISYDDVGLELTIDLDDLVTNKTQGDIETLFLGAPNSVTDHVAISVADSLASLASTLAQEPMTGGADAVGIADYTQGQVETAFAGADSSVTDLVSLSIADGTANLVSTLSEVVLQNGADAIESTLDADAKYVMIKQSDLHDLTDSETADGRKLVWGFIHKAAEAFAGLSDAPTNLTVTKGTLAPVDGGTALRQNYTVSARYAISALDLKAEA